MSRPKGQYISVTEVLERIFTDECSGDNEDESDSEASDLENDPQVVTADKFDPDIPCLSGQTFQLVMMSGERPATPDSEQIAIARLLLSRSFSHQLDTSELHVENAKHTQDSHLIELDLTMENPPSSNEELPMMQLSSLPEIIEDSTSPHNVVTSPTDLTSGRLYRCRLCNFSTMTYTQLQLHMPRHGGVKALKCNQCDYCTNDKSNFRRHKRLHIRNKPVSVLQCDKCPFSTILPRKIREHYIQIHNNYLPGNFEDIPPGIAVETCISQHADASISGVTVHPSGVQSYLHSDLLPFEQSRDIQSCVSSYSPYSSEAKMSHRDHTASNYLRSIVTSMAISSRVPPSSTVTSTSYQLLPELLSHTTTSESEMKVRLDDVKVKLEMDTSSDASTSGDSPGRSRTPDVIRQVKTDQAIGVLMDHGNCNEASSMRISRPPSSQMASMDSQSHKRDTHSSSEQVLNSTMLPELHHASVQCALPWFKREATGHEPTIFCRTIPSTETGVQCEILSNNIVRGKGWHHSREAEVIEPSLITDTRCEYCGVTFDDEVLFSIHMGCHSHTDPFTCNVCGKQCYNKYGFYSHIMRGHQC